MTYSDQAALADAYRSCRLVTAERAKSFYLGLRIAPQPERSSLYALYAWNRRGDDAVDAPGLSESTRRDRLDAFRAETEACLKGQPPSADPLWIALHDTVQRFGLRSEWFRHMLAGLASDLDQQQPSDVQALRSYCSQVAGSVGRCCVAIWGIEHLRDEQRAGELAETLGFAFQLTNILRDIGEDGFGTPARIYVPQSTFEQHGLDAPRLLRWSDPHRCTELVQSLAREAGSAFAAGEELMRLIRPAFRPTLWAMCKMYETTLRLIESEPRRAVQPAHVRPSKLAKVVIASQALALSARYGRGR